MAAAGTRPARSWIPPTLALVSDQELRTIVMQRSAGLGAPAGRGDVEGRPMSAGRISDVVAWLQPPATIPVTPYPISSTTGARGDRDEAKKTECQTRDARETWDSSQRHRRRGIGRADSCFFFFSPVTREKKFG